MVEKKLSVRHLQINDLELIVDYFLKSNDDFLFGMGVDISKLPSKQDWLNILTSNFYLRLEEKAFFYIIWLLDNQPVGHCNINKINFGEDAFMHLHLWLGQTRQKGVGFHFLKMTIPYFFDNFKLKTLYCEPSASNLSPNKTLEKLGFNFIKSYETTPGWINFHQLVNKWCLTDENFKKLYST